MYNLKQFLIVASLFGLALAGPLQKRSCSFCLDRANECGKSFGGCWDPCAEPQKTITVPGCNGAPDRTEICQYSFNQCSKLMGGCYPPGGPVPQFTNPGCGYGPLQGVTGLLPNLPNLNLPPLFGSSQSSGSYSSYDSNGPGSQGFYSYSSGGPGSSGYYNSYHSGGPGS